MVIGIFLLYYFISVRLYTTKGEKYEPKFSVYTIASGSMTPTLNVYDVIINSILFNYEEIKEQEIIIKSESDFVYHIFHYIVNAFMMKDNLCLLKNY